MTDLASQFVQLAQQVKGSQLPGAAGPLFTGSAPNDPNNPANQRIPFQIGPFNTGLKMPLSLSRGLAGTGQGMESIGRHVANLVGLESNQDLADAQKLDAPLLNTTAGKIGNLVGETAATAPFMMGGGELAGAGKLGQLAARRGDLQAALEFVESALARNAHNQKAAHLKALVLRKLGQTEAAREAAETALARDPLDFGARYELALLSRPDELPKLIELMGGNIQSYLAIAADYASAGAHQPAIDLLEIRGSALVANSYREGEPRAPGHLGEIGMPNAWPMLWYFQGYYAQQLGKATLARKCFAKAKAQSPDRCFPNSLESILVLEAALKADPGDGRASLYLGNLWYDKRQFAQATECWERARRAEPSLSTVHRNLSLAYFNKQHDSAKALKAMERAFAAEPTDARVLFELDLLKKRARVAPAKRLKFLEKHRALVEQREDLTVELVTLLNFFGQHQLALQILTSRQFHPWEGGEGKVTGQYVTSLVELAKGALGLVQPLRFANGDRFKHAASDPRPEAGSTFLAPKDKKEAARQAIQLLERARLYPDNLGEGKLHGAQENQVLYWLGVAQAQAGDLVSAKTCWREASVGMKSPSPAVYYNDQNPETIFYQGLARRELGQSAAAAQRFRTLIKFARAHL